MFSKTVPSKSASGFGAAGFVKVKLEALKDVFDELFVKLTVVVYSLRFVAADNVNRNDHPHMEQ